VPAALVRRVLRDFRVVFSPATFAELETRLWLPKFDRYITLESRKLLLHDLAAAADWVEPAPEGTFSIDPDDDKFVRTALAAKARWLVTGDRDLLSLGQVEDVLILGPAQALRRIESNPVA
jgi:uncharacterized protein